MYTFLLRRVTGFVVSCVCTTVCAGSLSLVLSSVDAFSCAAWSRKERAVTLVHGAHAYTALRDSRVGELESWRVRELES